MTTLRHMPQEFNLWDESERTEEVNKIMNQLERNEREKLGLLCPNLVDRKKKKKESRFFILTELNSKFYDPGKATLSLDFCFPFHQI